MGKDASEQGQTNRSARGSTASSSSSARAASSGGCRTTVKPQGSIKSGPSSSPGARREGLKVVIPGHPYVKVKEFDPTDAANAVNSSSSMENSYYPPPGSTQMIPIANASNVVRNPHSSTSLSLPQPIAVASEPATALLSRRGRARGRGRGGDGGDGDDDEPMGDVELVQNNLYQANTTNYNYTDTSQHLNIQNNSATVVHTHDAEIVAEAHRHIQSAHAETAAVRQEATAVIGQTREAAVKEVAEAKAETVSVRAEAAAAVASASSEAKAARAREEQSQREVESLKGLAQAELNRSREENLLLQQKVQQFENGNKLARK